jgi:hypothetical protein
VHLLVDFESTQAWGHKNNKSNAPKTKALIPCIKHRSIFVIIESKSNIIQGVTVTFTSQEFISIKLKYKKERRYK